MSSVPWMFQSHIADAKIRRFETALQAIAGLDWNAMTSDQALANLRDVITIARVALERQGLTSNLTHGEIRSVDVKISQSVLDSAISAASACWRPPANMRTKAGL
jgi:hypothetical protein